MARPVARERAISPLQDCFYLGNHPYTVYCSWTPPNYPFSTALRMSRKTWAYHPSDLTFSKLNAAYSLAGQFGFAPNDTVVPTHLHRCRNSQRMRVICVGDDQEVDAAFFAHIHVPMLGQGGSSGLDPPTIMLSAAHQ